MLDPVTISLAQRGSMWVISHDSTVMACATTRQGVIDAAAALLRTQLRDQETVSRMRFTGLNPEELLPPAAAPKSPALAATIDFLEAKRRVTEQWLPVAEKRIGTTARIVDGRCVEYEWGWVIHWEPADRASGDPRFVNEYHFPFTVDRVTGHTGLSGGTFGIERGIIELLQRRPQELCGPYPAGTRHWLAVIDDYEAAGAFTPLATGERARPSDTNPG